MGLIMAVVNKFGMLAKRHEHRTGAQTSYGEGYVKPAAFEMPDWTPPKGYAHSEVPLSQSRGFWLQNQALQLGEGAGAWVIYHLHGGGYIDPFVTKYCDTAVKYSEHAGGANVFSLDYRTAPEDPFPAALDDAVEGFEWLLSQGYAADHVIVCGDSAGGGLALSLCMRLRELGRPRPAALILASPAADLAGEGPSYRENLTCDICFGYYDAADAPEKPLSAISVYAGELDVHEPLISPAYGTYEGLPRMLIQVGGNEMLLSDSQTVAERARAAGVDVELLVYPEMFHIFYVMTPWLPKSRQAWRKIGSYIGELMEA